VQAARTLRTASGIAAVLAPKVAAAAASATETSQARLASCMMSAIFMASVAAAKTISAPPITVAASASSASRRCGPSSAVHQRSNASAALPSFMPQTSAAVWLARSAIGRSVAAKPSQVWAAS
jgi:hypothetical protein